MDTRDERPESALPEIGPGTPPAGWYPDPASGRGLRWWDGARWTAQLAMPTAPPAKAASRDLADTDTLTTAADPWAVEPSLPSEPRFGVRATKGPNARPSWGGVFGLESALVLGSFLVAWILIFGADACTPADESDRCLDLYGRGWLLLMAAHPVLLVGCGAAFLVEVFTKRVAVKRLAVWVLPIGMVTAWIGYAVITGIALDA